MISKINNQFFKNRYEVLFVSLIFLILLNPFFQKMAYGKWFLNIGVYVVSLIAIISFQHKPAKFAIGLVLGVLSISSNLVNETLLTRITNLSQEFLVFLFFSFVAIALFISILKEKEVTKNLIFAAVCAYLFIGFAFGGLYNLIEILSPNSFSFGQNIDEVQKTFAFHYQYLSFTVLTTVGFGDIVPLTAHAKSLVIIEEVIGVFYMAIFVSRLIAAERQQHEK